MLTRLGAREQQACQVHAGDQQQHGHRSQQPSERQRVGAPKIVESLRTGQQRQCRPLVGGAGANRLEDAPCTAQRRAERFTAYACCRPADETKPACVHGGQERRAWEQQRLHRERHRDIHRAARFEPEELTRRDADHRERLPHQVERATDNPGVTAEVALPEVVADHGDERPARPAVVGGLQQPAEDRRHAKHIEAVARHELPHREFRACGRRQPEAGPRPERAQPGKSIVGAKTPELVCREREAVARAHALREQHELPWSANGQRLEQHRIDERVDGGDGADAKGQRQHGHSRKRRAFPQDSDAVTHVLQELRRRGGRPHVAARFSRVLETTEAGQCATSGLGLGQALTPVIGNLAFDVVPQLGVDFTIELVPEQRASASVRPRAFPPSPGFGGPAIALAEAGASSCHRDCVEHGRATTLLPAG